MKRTLENCRIFKMYGGTQYDGVCEGVCKSSTDDEPCEACKKCSLHYLYEKPEPKRRRKFDYMAWDYDGNGEAFIIAKDLCPNRDDVPEWLVDKENLVLEVLDGNNPEHLSINDIKSGWCKYQCRSDWLNDYDLDLKGSYYCIDEVYELREVFYERGDKEGKKKPGWFPVWIVRKGAWY